MSEPGRPGRMLAFLKLIRLPNVFTAAADSLAGWVIAGSALVDPAHWWPLPLASMCVYAAGMALNDLCDLKLDRKERPDRPLPSGAIKPAHAWFLVATLFSLAWCLVSLTHSVQSLIVLGSLIASVVAYDVFLRRTLVGPVSMGTCRGLNLALGLSVAADLGGVSAWLAALAFGLFVTGITYISLSEVEGGRSRSLWLGRNVQRAAFVGFVLSVGLRLLQHPPGLIPPWNWGLPPVILGLALWKNELAGKLAWFQASPGSIQNVVRTGIFSLIWLDTALAASAGGLWAIAVAACWIPARLAGKWLYST